MIAGEIILMDLCNKGKLTSNHDFINQSDLPERDVVAAIIESLATKGNGPFTSDNEEAARILAPLIWRCDWSCYEYGLYEFALSGIMSGIYDPFKMPNPPSDTMRLEFCLERIEEESKLETKPRFKAGMMESYLDRHNCIQIIVPAYDGSSYQRITEYGGRSPYSGQIGHARDKDVEKLAYEIADIRQSRWQRRKKIDAKVALIRERVVAEIGNRSHVELLSVSLENGREGKGEEFLVRMLTIGHDLHETIEEVKLSTRLGAKKPSIGSLRHLLVKLDKRHDQAKRGIMIDEIVAKALDSMGSFTQTLAKYSDVGQVNKFTTQWYEGHVPGLVTSYQLKDGCITAKVKLAEGVYWNNGNITLQKMQLSDSLIASMPGRRLGEVIEGKWIDKNQIINSCRKTSNGSVTIRVKPHHLPLSVM